MDIPFRELLGREPGRVEQVFDYGYRGVCKAFDGEDIFVVKFDHRPAKMARERAAHEYAGQNGVPVPAVVGYMESPACLALAWVAGVSLAERPSPAAARATGVALKRIHALDPPTRRTEPLAVWLRSWFDAELEYMVSRQVIEPEERLEALLALEALRPVLDVTPTSWIHGDCQAAHFLLEPSTGQLNAVLDWADAQHGPPEIDFAVLTLFDDDLLESALEGYGADAEFRGRLALTLPMYQAIRAAGAYHWLEENGYAGQLWPIERVKGFAAAR